MRNGGELASCVAELKKKLDCVEICLAAYSLKQMKKSGRVSAAAAVVGDLLGIRPIISLNAGVSKVESKVRGDAAVPAAIMPAAPAPMTITSKGCFSSNCSIRVQR